MRISHSTTRHGSCRVHQRRRNEHGSAILVVIALLAIVLLYVGANLRTLGYLGRELKRVDEQQTRRLQAIAAHAQTNSIVQVDSQISPSGGRINHEPKTP